MIHSVQNLLIKLDGGINETKMSLDTCILNFQADLQGILLKHVVPNSIEIQTLNKYIFTNFTETDNIEMFCKANLWAANITFNRLIQRISKFKGGIKYYNIKKFRDFIMIFISDLKGIVEFFERKYDPDYVFVKDSYPSLIEANEINEMSNKFLYPFYIQDQKINSLQFLGLSVINLRQSIEIRTKRAVGIYKVINKDNCHTDFGFKQLINFIEHNKSIIEYEKFSFENLKAIYNWSSDYVHNAILPLIWQVEHALHETKEFYSPGSYNDVNNHKWSIYGRIRIHDYDALKIKISHQFDKCYKFHFLNDPDALQI